MDAAFHLCNKITLQERCLVCSKYHTTLSNYQLSRNRLLGSSISSFTLGNALAFCLPSFSLKLIVRIIKTHALQVYSQVKKY